MGSKGKRPGRGRQSTIDQLPDDIRIKLNEALRDRRLTQKEILASINGLLKDRGEKPLSKSAVNRYSMAIEEKGAMMRQAREAADALVGGLAEYKGTDLGRANTDIVKTLVFDVVMKGLDGEGGGIDIDALNKLALVTQRLERASKISLDRETKLREQILAEAADTVEETAIQSGMNEEQAQLWREKILGIK
ncbi:MAG: DUF3486 family protein [Desulfobacterales bacterium]|nr:DUF3486 family protein [Desulfobacterales bacterium]